MSLVDRARLALFSNLNGIVSHLEQAGSELPALLEQMAQELNKAKRELLRVMGEEKVLRERSKARFAESEKWQSRAELAVKAANDELAREALNQARRLQGESARDGGAADEYGALAQSMRADIAHMEQKHRDWSARQNTIGTRIQQARSGGGVESLGAKAGRSPFDAFREAEQAVEEAEFSAEGQREMQEVLSPRPELENEFAKLERDSAPKNAGATELPRAGAPETADAAVGKRRVRIE